MSRHRKLFYGFTLTVLTVLLLLPGTGWLVRLQWSSVVLEDGIAAYVMWWNGISNQYDPALNRKIHAPRPRTFLSRYGETLHDKNYDQLLKEFPTLPSANAAWLRNHIDTLPLYRSDDEILCPPVPMSAKMLPSGPPPDGPPGLKAARSYSVTPADDRPDRQAVVRFLAVAQRGERLDPSNAFFPILRACALFAAHRDKAALDAWGSAASKSYFNDYATDEIAAKWQFLSMIQNGDEVGFFPRYSMIVYRDYEYLQHLRKAARLAIASAVRAERGGDTKRAMILRRATMNIGVILRNQGRDGVRNLAGQSVISIAGLFPGGAVAVRDGSTDGKQKLAHQHEAYINYLKRSGMQAEAKRYQREVAIGSNISAVFVGAHDTSFTLTIDNAVRLLCWWLIDSALIAVILGLLAVRIMAELAHRCPFPPQLRSSWRAVLSPGSARANYFAGVAAFTALLLHAIMLQVSNVCQIPWLFLTISPHATDWSFFTYVPSAFALLPDPMKSSLETAFPFWVSGAGVGIAMFLPLTLLALCLVWKLPVRYGVVRGIRALALPITCVFLLLYAICVGFTAHQENAALHELKQIQAIGEWQTFAQFPENAALLQGKTIPIQ